MRGNLFSTPVSLLYVEKRFANRLFDAVENGDPGEMQEYLNDCMADPISFLDGGTLEQITVKDHDAFFGIDVPPEIIHYGIAFYKKRCRVRMEWVQGA